MSARTSQDREVQANNLEIENERLESALKEKDERISELEEALAWIRDYRRVDVTPTQAIDVMQVRAREALATLNREKR